MNHRRVTTKRLLAAAVAALALALAGCGAPINVLPLAPEDLPRLAEIGNFPARGYRVEPGDTLHLRFPFHPDMDQEVIVRPDGEITATRIGPLRVAGLSTVELERLLVERTSDRLRDPEVVVTIRRFSEKSVYVGGEVGKPGTIVYRSGLTPLQAIIAAGGFRDTARVDSVILVRSGGTDRVVMTRKLDLGQVVSNGLEEPLEIAPHDIVFVPRTEVADAGLWVRQHIIDLIPFFRGATLPLLF